MVLRQLNGAQWARIAPMMPTPRGNRRLSSRQVLDGWLLVTKEGSSWRALPERYSRWHTVYMRGRRWIDKGMLEPVFAELQRDEPRKRRASRSAACAEALRPSCMRSCSTSGSH